MEVKDVIYDSEYVAGCETCDYGSEYIDDIKIVFNDDNILKIKTNTSYGYIFSAADYIKIICNSNNIKDIILNLLLKGKSYLEDIEIAINDSFINTKETFEKSELVYLDE